MSPDKQNVAIAEALGYTRGVGMNGLEWWTNSEGVHDEPPYYDYVTSLDAMHEAEKVLSYDDQLEYMANLSCLCFGSGDQAQDTHWNYIHATAAQRAAAFLRTIGKWESE